MEKKLDQNLEELKIDKETLEKIDYIYKNQKSTTEKYNIRNYKWLQTDKSFNTLIVWLGAMVEK